VAKRVAESVCGIDAVNSFVRAQINEGGKTNNMSKTQLWQWVSTLSPDTSLDFLKETDRLVRRYKRQLQSLKSGIDFSNPNWWL
ncbi:MAG TPA: hypothetical protein VKL99_06920, partial [Candidatus Angelobacter sp.]|nr:hypothetical protein [Candidatus Angelobacter sp.]